MFEEYDTLSTKAACEENEDRAGGKGWSWSAWPNRFPNLEITVDQQLMELRGLYSI